jgi:hypothetical protein
MTRKTLNLILTRRKNFKTKKKQTKLARKKDESQNVEQQTERGGAMKN